MTNTDLQQKLQQQLQATHVDIVDNSWQHAGHAAMAGVHTNPHQASGTHLAVVIVSPQFEGVNLLNRHRLVHQVLKTDFEGPLHALELKVYTPSEWDAL